MISMDVIICAKCIFAVGDRWACLTIRTFYCKMAYKGGRFGADQILRYQEGTLLKRICQLAIAFFWLTAPVVTFVLLRRGAAGSYPFFAASSCIYRLLHRSTNLAFLFAVPALYVVWTVISAMCFLLRDYPSLRVVPGSIAAIDLLLALVQPFSPMVVLLDALILFAILCLGSRGMRIRLAGD